MQSESNRPSAIQYAFWIALAGNALAIACSMSLLSIPRGTFIRPMNLALETGLIGIATFGLVTVCALVHMWRTRYFAVSFLAIFLSLLPLPCSSLVLHAAVQIKGLKLEP